LMAEAPTEITDPLRSVMQHYLKTRLPLVQILGGI
jgi:hypothetical protein